MKHHTTPKFWEHYERLPQKVKRLADKNYELLKSNPNHPSLNFKKIDNMWSVRVGVRYRALGFDHAGSVLWFWIGSHAEYDRLMP